MTVVYKLIIVILFILITTGCSSFNEPTLSYPTPIVNKTQITLTLVETFYELPDGVKLSFRNRGMQLNQLKGVSVFFGEDCRVWVLKDSYQECLLHEVLHCIAGNFHEPNQANTDYCLK
jgi:hypothetical protein